MAQLADRVAYRLAGFVWTAIYSGLAGSSRETRSTIEQRPSLAAPASTSGSGQAVAA